MEFYNLGKKPGIWEFKKNLEKAWIFNTFSNKTSVWHNKYVIKKILSLDGLNKWLSIIYLMSENYYITGYYNV